MNRLSGFLVGAVLGSGIAGTGGTLLLRGTGYGWRAQCRSPWSAGGSATIASTSDAAACRLAEPHRTNAVVRFGWSSARLGMDRNPRSVLADALAMMGVRAAGSEIEEGSTSGQFGRLTLRRDVAERAMTAEVYLVSGGRRFALLSIVHGPAADFSAPATTARWMEGIGGAAPWGAPNDTPFTASCPDGFRTMPTTAPRAIVRCTRGYGTSAFTAISMSWDEGGFGREEDRVRVASALAERVGQHPGGMGRVSSPPVPFVLARNVDAMHTRVETGETVSIAREVTLSWFARGNERLFAVTDGEPDPRYLAFAEDTLRSALADRSGSPLARRSTRTLATGLGAIVVASGLLGAVLFGGRRTRSRASTK